MTPTPPVLAFIGGGNMARALIAGLLRAGTPADRIHVAEPNAELRDALAADFGVRTHAGNADAVASATVWVLATKPQVLRGVCEALQAQAQAKAVGPLVISIAAGITTTQLLRWLAAPLAVVRSMPNTPALLGAGVTGLFANAGCDAGQRALAEGLLRACGDTVWIADEAQMDAVTAVSGSGPAYIFLLAEALQAAGEAEGLPADAARTLALQTIAGAARMLVESGEPAGVLRERVTSPNGTTQAALDAFRAGGFAPLVATAVHAARVRGAELSAANDSP
jgi:pyrroline-5-carboxylate reductase